jgi:hypothetical protein
MKHGYNNSYQPTDKELHNKLREVRELIRLGKWRPAAANKLEVNFDELDEKFGIECDSIEQRNAILLIAAEEATPADYDGERPPEKAYEPEIKGQPLYAFCWKSTHFGAQMYFKFALKGTDNNRKAYLVSIHESRKKRN